MRSCISRILKDHFFAFEELLKNDVLFSGGMMRLVFEWGNKTRCTGVHSTKNDVLHSEALASLQVCMWWKNFFLNRLKQYQIKKDDRVY